MPSSSRAEESVSAAQAAAFRLQRQRLADLEASSDRIVDVVRATAGIQAQVMSAAEMAIWTRRRETRRDEIQRTLWDTREIVRTSAMRLTLHLVPARDLPIYIAAMKPTTRAILARWQARLRITREHVRTLVAILLEALDDGIARTQQDLVARAKRMASRGMRAWLDHGWSAVRPAVIEGVIVYGPPRGAEATFVRADRWLGKQATVDVADARAELMRRFLAAFGPATPQDFSKWSGMKTSDAKTVVDGIRDELAQVTVDGAAAWLLRRDVPALKRSELDASAIRLLGAFDSFLLAHATKEHLVDARFYKRVYRPQGWISPVVLRGGTIVGVWFPKTAGKTTALGVDLFERVTPDVRRALAREATALSVFLGTNCIARFG